MKMERGGEMEANINIDLCGGWQMGETGKDNPEEGGLYLVGIAITLVT